MKLFVINALALFVGGGSFGQTTTNVDAENKLNAEGKKEYVLDGKNS